MNNKIVKLFLVFVLCFVFLGDLVNVFLEYKYHFSDGITVSAFLLIGLLLINIFASVVVSISAEVYEIP